MAELAPLPKELQGILPANVIFRLEEMRRALGDTSIVYLNSANNLSDIPDEAAARQNLGVEIGVDVQAFGAVLDDINALGPNVADGEILVGTGAGALAWESGGTARISLGVEIGADVQAWSAVLDGTTASFTTADETKLDAIEALADVTDTANVTAAGALMDSELADIAAVKAINQGLATSDTPSFAAVEVSGTQVVSGQGAAVADASGGSTVDTEARTAINDLLARLRTHGLIAT